MKIMILEDELGLAYTLSAALDKELGGDCTVKICNTAEVALQMLKIHTFDLIVSDWRLPGISGLDFITQVRELLPDVPIIFMTAFDSEQFENQVYSIADFFIKKPFEIQEMTRVIERLLHSRNYKEDVAFKKPERVGKILVLEDDSSLLNLYRKVFNKFGHEVYTAQTLPEANKLLQQEEFDLFICDVRINKSFGVDLILIWRDKLLKSGTKVVVVSGDPWYRLMSEKIGAHLFFRKPVEMSTLVNLANTLVPIKDQI